MSSVVTLSIVLLVLAGICLVIIFLHNRSKQKQAGWRISRFTKIAHENKLVLSDTDQLVHGMLGIDYSNNKLCVFQEPVDCIIDIGCLKRCHKQKKWLHIPASKDNHRPETHLEKIVLACEFKQQGLPVELVFYEYQYNSIFQMQELEQQADYWEIVINQQMNSHETVQA